MSERRQKKERDDSPLYMHKAEHAVVGEALQNANFFWSQVGRLKSSYFTVPRLARIWEAMIRAAEKGKPPTKTWVPAFIQNDSGEEHPLLFFLNLLINDAAEERDSIDIHADTVLNLANKRAVIDAIDQARIKILKSEFDTPPEHLQDIAMKALATSIDADYDKDLRSYEEWGHQAFLDAAANVDRTEEQGSGIGLPCGLRAVEEVLGRLLPGKVYVLAGMAGAGKSALARQILEAAALEAQRRKLGASYVASLEMTGKEYAIRSLSAEMGIPFHLIEKGAIERAQVESLDGRARKLKRFGIQVDSKPGMSMDEIKARMQKVKVQHGGLALGVVDHYVILGGERGESLFDRISAASIKAKVMAKELEIPMIMLAQLNEKKILESGSGWPNASHLFGGETITQNADVVAFIHRHELVLSKKEPATETPAHDKWLAKMNDARGKAHFFNDKRRGGEGRVTRELRFQGPTMLFEDI